MEKRNEKEKFYIGTGMEKFHLAGMVDNYANFDVAVLLNFGRLRRFTFWFIVVLRGESCSLLKWGERQKIKNV
jgi:hypothetical protein